MKVLTMRNFVCLSPSGFASALLIGSLGLASWSACAANVPQAARPVQKPDSGKLEDAAKARPVPDAFSSRDATGPLSILTTSWEGMATDFTLEPPDPHGAAGPAGIFQTINLRVAYWSKFG